MSIDRRQVDPGCFNRGLDLPYELRLLDFQATMQDVYDFFYDVNGFLDNRGLGRLEDTLRKAILSGVLSDMLTASLAAHSRTLVENGYHNGHPDLVVKGLYADDSVRAGSEGVEIKTTLKKGGAVDTHGARDQWFCVFVYQVDRATQPASDRSPLRFSEVYLAEVTTADFRRNERGDLGTRTATLHAAGVKKLRSSWVYLDPEDSGEGEEGS